MASKPLINNFLELDAEHAEYSSARYAILPIPYDAAASYRPGARNAPAAIIEASRHCETFDEEILAECQHAGISTMEAIPPNRDGPEAMHRDIFNAAKTVVRDGKMLIGLGGDHSVTAGLVRAVATRFKKLSVLQIDAHTDLRNRFEKSLFSHACVMRRVYEMSVNIVPVGIRASAAEEHRFMRRTNIRPITAVDCHRSDDWQNDALHRLGEDVYITVDIDGFDPAYAPGTGTPEPGGLDWYQVISLLRKVAAQKRIVGADVVEVMPIPGQVVTEFLAARLIYKLICYVESNRPS